MKAKQHIAVHGFLILTFFILVFYFENFRNIFGYVFNQINRNLFVLIFGIILYFLGAVLPDSDSNNKKSYIFYTIFFPIAYVVNFLEYPLLVLTKRKRGHRQSLHTIFGILLSSLVVVLFFSLIFFLVLEDFPIIYFTFWFICLLTGQFLHLIEDKISNPKWKVSFV